ncbi:MULTISPECIES: xanthine dehydrogenase accessory protein XdhC [Halocynthiibacter]|uniref:Xanthine dehydrogenase accessory protein XdhC n=1 Tax=Halocynthiibacter halioticoli TaxID=2986804 RepID=A0AAE3IX11_9RHOB|nr:MULTISPECIES: xanthine dehydrogenase accessory protein XdhC [Halocynthiibacter]MCV6823653.1 xanthine dehydrogenase accessory protein XdhC [Halocynthiibacter halioticoli]MCW4056654.1 xanthine dehydrogenase accessory protein XdhC [Halocynthiibacter sp. SDUM655004]
MHFDRDTLAALVAKHGDVARVVIAETSGSAPREAGAVMYIWSDGLSGTIGGGALEYQAIHDARAALSDGSTPVLSRIPLGPNIGQCCGGSVTLVFEIFNENTLPAADDTFARPVAPHATVETPKALGFKDGWLIEQQKQNAQPIWIWGAGHVGHALATVLAPLPDFAVTLIDATQERMPDGLPETVTPVTAADLPALVKFAPHDARHFIMTYDHAIDLALCHALLSAGNQQIGLIGSTTKWARFRKRLAGFGHTNAQINGIACPIGDPAAGKHPQAIAVSVATRLLLTSQSKNSAPHKRGVA